MTSVNPYKYKLRSYHSAADDSYDGNIQTVIDKYTEFDTPPARKRVRFYTKQQGYLSRPAAPRINRSKKYFEEHHQSDQEEDEATPKRKPKKKQLQPSEAQHENEPGTAAAPSQSKARTSAISFEETYDYGSVVRLLKMLETADDHVKMAEELLKIPNMFYVVTSLTVLKRVLKDDEKALTNAQQKIAAKVGKVKELYDEIDEKLAGLSLPGRRQPTESDRREELIVQPTVSIQPEEPTGSPEANEIAEEEAKDVPKETEEEESVNLL